MRKKYGVVAGKFRILHTAHKELLKCAITEEIDELHVIINNPKDVQRHANVYELAQAISEILRDYRKKYYIHISTYNSSISSEAYDQLWDKEVINLVSKTKSDKVSPKEIVVYNSKENYSNSLIDNHYLNLNTDLSLSASLIEKNLYADSMYKLISPEFARYLNKKYVISGIESSGKTTMASRLADHYDTTFIEEVGRFYNGDYLGGSSYFEAVYKPEDFLNIAIKQLIQDFDLNLTAKRLVFIDSDPVITLRLLMFYKSYYQEIDMWSDELEKDYLLTVKQLEQLIKGLKVDKVILLKPAPFINDGTRIEIDQATRDEQYQILKDLYDKYQIDYQVFEFSGDYDLRFASVVDFINEQLLIS